MLALKPFRKSTPGFPSLLNYFALVEEGVLLGKDGSLMAACMFSGPDMDAASAELRTAVAARVNACLCKLGTGWMLHADTLRMPVAEYPLTGSFPDPTSALIEAERRRQFTEADRHFKNTHVLTLAYKPLLGERGELSRLFVLGGEKEQTAGYRQHLEYFRKTMEEVFAALSGSLEITRMDSAGLLRFLHLCITGREIPLQTPEVCAYLHHLLGGYELAAGLEPRLDGQNLGAVAVTGFPQASMPGMLETLAALPFSYRISTRFMALDPQEAVAALKKLRTRLHNKQFDLFSIASQILMPGSGSAYRDSEAARKAQDADEAVTEAREGLVKYGYYTAVAVVFAPGRAMLETRLHMLRKTVEQCGFPARIETVNAVEAYLGSLPGHAYANIRKPLLHTLNLAHLLPLGAPWTGERYNPNPKFPESSPPLCMAVTTGARPFQLNLHVSDVGHTLALGPTGAGKSTLLAFLCAQFLRYPSAQIFCFDKGMSQYATALVCGGAHYHILAEESDLCFCPLAAVDREQERLWAAEWLETLVILQGQNVTPALRAALHEALQLLAQQPGRTLSDFHALLRTPKLREALAPFVARENGIMARLLDARADTLADSHFQVFEMEALMSKAGRLVVPALTYLFHAIERRLDGRPTLLVLDEAWLLLDHPLFKEKIREWLKVLRKANAAVVFATQSLADIMRSSICESILESCPTRIFLPNANALSPSGREHYQRMGLTEEQIAQVSLGLPKRQYYAASPLGARLIELDLGPVALAFTGINRPEEIRALRALREQHPNDWPARWLEQTGLIEQAAEWRKLCAR